MSKRSHKNSRRKTPDAPDPSRTNPSKKSRKGSSATSSRSTGPDESPTNPSDRESGSAGAGTSLIGKPTWIFVLLLIGISGAAYLFVKSGQLAAISEEQEDSHARMVRELKEVAQRATFNNDYFKTAGIEEMTARLAEPNVGLEEQFNLHLQLGRLQLNLGNNEEAVGHLQQVFGMANRVASAMSPEQQKEQLSPLLMELAVAYLRIGEAQNCIHCQTGESCILPIRNTGIHSEQHGSRESIKYLTRVLQLDPQDLGAAWLLNVAYMTLGEQDKLKSSDYYISLDTGETEFPEFTDVAREVGIAEFSCSGGAASEDYDGDGDLDLVVSNWDVNGQLKVFLNNGDGTFSDFTEDSGVTGITGGLNILQGDYDNDGDVDLYVLRGAWQAEIGKIPNSLLQNDGAARFRDVTFESGLGDEHFPTQTGSFADYDNDGDLDLFVGNENVPCSLFENDGNGKFKDVAERAGVTDGGYPKGVVFGDYDNDRWPDIFVSNIAGANRLFHNNGDGTFEEVAEKANVTKPYTSLPAWFWDYNNDGNLDIYGSSYKAGIKFVGSEYFGQPLPEENYQRFYRGDGKGGFVNQTKELGLETVIQPMGCNFGDLDNDGFQDFYIGTGYTEFAGLMPNRLFHNLGGEKFEDVTIPARVGHLQKGHGVVFADFDRDGDQDLFIEMGGAFAGDAFRNTLFRNPGFNNNHVKLRLEGVTSNRSAIGARIRVDIIENGKPRSVHRRLGAGGSFGENPLEQHIGIGQAEGVAKVEVYWPTSDTRQVFENLEANQSYYIHEEDGISKR